MQVKGKEIRFMRTVKINFEIADFCPEGKIEKIGDLFTGTDSETISNMVGFIQLMHKGYEDYKKYEDPSYVPEGLSTEDLMYLPYDQMQQLFVEATQAFFGVKQTVEVEPSKSKKKTNVTSD